MATAAIISALLPALIQAGGSFLSKKFDKSGSSEQFPTMGQDQQNLQSQIISMLGPMLSGEGGLGGFGEPARKEFFESTVPGLAEKFSGLGLQKSSAFNQALGKAGQDLSSQLQGQQMGLLGQLLPAAFGSQFGTGFQGAQPGGFAEAFEPFGEGLGKISSGGIAELIQLLRDKMNTPGSTEIQTPQV